MKNFLLGYFAIHLALLAIACLLVILNSHGGAGVLLLGGASGFLSVVLWQAMDLPDGGRLERKDSIRRPE